MHVWWIKFDSCSHRILSHSLAAQDCRSLAVDKCHLEDHERTTSSTPAQCSRNSDRFRMIWVTFVFGSTTVPWIRCMRAHFLGIFLYYIDVYRLFLFILDQFWYFSHNASVVVPKEFLNLSWQLCDLPVLVCTHVAPLRRWRLGGGTFALWRICPGTCCQGSRASFYPWWYNNNYRWKWAPGFWFNSF